MRCCGGRRRSSCSRPAPQGERALARFEREVQLTAGLTHPSTIAIYDYGRTADGVFYYAMELLRGINLTQLVEFDGPLPPGASCILLRAGLRRARRGARRGPHPRDIKPANLMICVYGGIPDFLKVLDFGLVKDIGAVERAQDGGAADRRRRRALAGRLAPRHAPLHGARGDERLRRTWTRARTSSRSAPSATSCSTGNSPFPGRTAIEVFKTERQGPPPPLSRAAPNPVPS